MQADSKAKVEDSLDHALAVHFQNARRGKAAHQRLAHLGRANALVEACEAADVTLAVMLQHRLGQAALELMALARTGEPANWDC